MFSVDPYIDDVPIVKRDSSPAKLCHAQPKPEEPTPNNCNTSLMSTFPRLSSHQLVPCLGIDAECQLPSPLNPLKEPPASPANEPGSRGPEAGSPFKRRHLQEQQRRPWGRGAIGDSEDQPKPTSGRMVSGSACLGRGGGDQRGWLTGALGSDTSVNASITTDIGSNIQNCSSTRGDLDASPRSVRKSLSFKDRQRYGPPNSLPSRMEPIQPDIRMIPATQTPIPRTTLPRELTTGSTNILCKENTTSVIGGGGTISDGRSSGTSLVNLRLSVASLMDHVNTGTLTPPQYSPSSSMACDYRKSGEWKTLAKEFAQTHSSPPFSTSPPRTSPRQQELHYVHGLPPLQHHRFPRQHDQYQRPLQQRTEGYFFTPSPPVSSRRPQPPSFLSSMHSSCADSLSSNGAPQSHQSQQSHGSLFEPVRGDPPLALPDTDMGFAFAFADMSGDNCIEESTIMSSQRCEADRTLPPQPMQSTLPMVSETVLTRTDTSQSPSTWGSLAPMGRDREKIFRRKPSQSTVANVIKSPRPVDEGSFPFEMIDSFMQRVHGSDLSAGTPPQLMLYPTCETSNSRICGDSTLPAAAKRGNRRRSSFSSLYFSMTKQCKELHRAKMGYQTSQNIVDDDTVHENRGDSRRDELLDKDSGEDSFNADELQTIGMQETEEHVFIPRYEILEDGQTPMEIMISSIRVSTESRASRSGNPSTTGIAAAATAAANAAKSKRADTKGNPLDITNGDRRRWSRSPSVDAQDDVFTFGVVSPAYATDPEEESGDVDCKVAARLLFDAEHGVAVLNACDEVSKYISKTVVSNSNEAGDDAGDHCKCSMEFIIKDMRGFDYSRYNAHDLYHHCVYCARRPAAFLCLHCLQATCPSHVTRHYKNNEGACTLFLNQLDITTSYDRVFWCEKCESFTWRHTEAYDPLVDQLVVTRGSYLHEAVRDVSCVGYNVQLKRPVRFSASSLLASPQRDRCCLNSIASAIIPSALPAPLMASSLHTPLDLPAFPSNTAAQHDTSRRFTVPSLGASPLVTQLFLQRDVESLRGPNALRVGEAVPRLVALGAKVQGWRTTQEDAEVAFVVNIPSLTAQPQPTSVESRGKTGGDNAGEHGGDKDHAAGEEEEETIPMAVFCVFDGHGGDAVAKLAARLFESHLRKAIATSPYENDARARALLFHLDIESSSPAYSLGESSPVHSRINMAHNHNQGRDHTSNPCGGPSMLEMYVDEEDVQEIVFTEEALRRHMESTTMFPTASEPNPTVAPTRLQTVSVSESSAQHMNDHTASPLVSPQEMEMLRVYFASIMEDALLSLDDALRLSPEGRRGDYQCVGCTACIVGITTNFILCANVGDSGAAYYTPHTIQFISAMHRTTDTVEEQRIRAAGYALHGNRIEGLLAVPRALGDYDFKQCGGKGPREQAVVAVPDVTIMPVPSLLETERWGVLVACDGVWDSATLRQVHHAIVNTRNDLDVAASASEAVVQAGEMVAEMRHSSAAEIVEVDPLLLTSAAGIFAQCVAPEDNNEGIGMDNCSVMLIERR